jgi:GNAT superfamily N-acetyltransferase
MPNSALSIRSVTSDDVPVLFSLVRSLADYEKLLHEVVGQEVLLHEHLFGESPVTEALLAEWEDQVAGFALFFPAYTPDRAETGIYLEDLFVLPNYRRKGIGKALLATLAQRVLDRQGRFLSWCVLDWNTPAIAFYRSLGTQIDTHRRICRVTGERLTHLAQQYQPTFNPVQPLTAKNIPPFVEWLQSHLGVTSGDANTLQSHLAGPSVPLAFAIHQENRVDGGLLAYTTYSTFLTRPGFFVTTLASAKPNDTNIAINLLSYLAHQAVSRGYGRLEWAVMATDTRAIAHYTNLGAALLDDWRFCRLDGDPLATLATLGR